VLYSRGVSRLRHPFLVCRLAQTFPGLRA